MRRRAAALLWLGLLPAAARAGLESDLGRNEVRIWSEPYPLTAGLSVAGAELPRRLERLGYERVHERPDRPGEYFWGHERFWIYRRAYEWDGRSWDDRLIGLSLERATGTVTGLLDAEGGPLAEPDGAGLRLEPELLAEAFDARRARTVRVELDRLPEHVWRAVLAAEDHRFFQHEGVDARGIARAMLRNALAGKVVQGGSTITQQLVKLRDLSPQRTLGRKVSEAVRALALEADYSKEEILEAYLNAVYFGHVEGISIYGLGTAAHAWLGEDADELTLAEGALLAAMIQGPNRLAPDRHPERALERQRWVLSRLEELGWASDAEIKRAREAGLPRLALRQPQASGAPAFLDALQELMGRHAPRRAEEGRGIVIESGLDPLLQEAAERAVAEGLEDLRRRHGEGGELQAALVALDASSGLALAYVGGDPGAGTGAYDRARRARRQVGSAVKPLLLLEAFEDCGARDPLYPARQVLDAPVRMATPTGLWEPVSRGREFRGVVDLRAALIESLNTPFVRLAGFCGFSEVAARVRRTGYELPEEAPPSFVLGAVETTPWALAGAYTVFVQEGDALAPRLASRLQRPGGSSLDRLERDRRRVVGAESTYLAWDLLRDSVARGIASSANVDGTLAWGKTGTTEADAWFAGGAESLVAVVWVGRDDGRPAGLSGTASAIPIWRAFMERAVRLRPRRQVTRPEGVVEARIQDATGLRVSRRRRRTHTDLFRRGELPPHRRIWREDEPVPVLDDPAP
ncbi:MAG: transglycosylase domain-containing protein [Thermoanaerobaculia bacterium]